MYQIGRQHGKKNMALTAILLSAVLSSTTTASALSVSRFNVRIELYGCTTTSL